jgi:ferredoxin-thioredoxin reductase catalytic subunit
MSEKNISASDIQKLYEMLSKASAESGYNLNPDMEFTKVLIEGLLKNKQRYGYSACPCRLASGIKEEDIDIICPCDYRDPDLGDYGACYCALYVSERVKEGEQDLQPIPDRRPLAKEKESAHQAAGSPAGSSLSHPVWRCRVCGYLCAREEPPEVCPICKAEKERFEQFM